MAVAGDIARLCVSQISDRQLVEELELAVSRGIEMKQGDFGAQ